MINDIPLMFQAQIEGRCQLQRLEPKANGQQAHTWVDQWIDATSDGKPTFGGELETNQNINQTHRVVVKEYQMIWRVISNSGQDQGVIRPVIGAKGWPFFPGSSMKGAFRRACTREQADRYCGKSARHGETSFALLRFHGAYPKNWDWASNSDLVDIAHPQENWQIKGNDNHSAFIQISLYQPILVFGISSRQELSKAEWDEIWKIWDKAISLGIGTRVSAGYGHAKMNRDNALLSLNLKGRGLASQLIKVDNQVIGEFRSNMFKAALRGHTLRLFLGVTDHNTAQELTRELWGGFAPNGGSVLGLVGVIFDPEELNDIQYHTYTPASQSIKLPLYDLKKGTLTLIPQSKTARRMAESLRDFLTRIIKFTLIFGGFGKSWRRINHDIFDPSYLGRGNKPMIGCHWEILPESRNFRHSIKELNNLTTFLSSLKTQLTKWVKYRKGEAKVTTTNSNSDYREVWHPDNVQVWARIAESDDDSHAIKWFHGPYSHPNSIKGSHLTGKLGQIGRIWHRMYPRYIKDKNGNIQKTRKYIEILTIFPKRFSGSLNSEQKQEKEKQEKFLAWMETSSSDFTRISW